MADGHEEWQGPTFSADVSVEGEECRLVLVGELDLSTVPVLRERAEDAHARASESVMIDLRELTFIDSTGVRELISIARDARSRGASIAVVPGGGQVRKILELSGLGDQLPLRDA